MRDETDLGPLDGLDNTLLGDGNIRAGIALAEALTELRNLRQILATQKPVCPHCKTVLKATKYEGYYDSFTYWSCNCNVLPNVEETWEGGYA